MRPTRIFNRQSSIHTGTLLVYHGANFAIQSEMSTNAQNPPAVSNQAMGKANGITGLANLSLDEAKASPTEGQRRRLRLRNRKRRKEEKKKIVTNNGEQRWRGQKEKAQA